MEAANLWVGLVSGLIGIVGGAYGFVRFVAPMLARHSPWIERIYDQIFAVGEAEYRRRWRSAADRLNAAATGQARLEGLMVDGMPLPEREDHAVDRELDWLADSTIAARAAAVRSNSSLSNKSHGLLIGKLSLVAEGAPLRFARTDFAVICAAREFGKRPPILSAGGIVFCPTDRTVLLQRRGEHVATYPQSWHLLGGNYEPAIEHNDADDQYNEPLLRTAVREIDEESHLRTLNTRRAFVSCAEETMTGFVQFMLVGVAISKARKSEVYGSREGAARFLSLEEIVTTFTRPPSADGVGGRWVPSGALHLAAWLAMGAPDQNRQAPMRREAIAAFEALLPHLHKGFASVDGRALNPAP
jgi:ADP-ribose pyrophosphatase YjhB (NUDIX family)